MKKSLKVLIASSAILLGASLLAGCEEKIPVSQIHEHTFSENWEANDGSHWHKATCEHTDVMSGVEDHKFGAWNTTKEPTEAAAGEKARTCTVCQYVQKAEIAPLAHVHTFKTEYASDDDNHWHVSDCHPDIITGVEAHTYGNWTVTVQPTETSKGTQERICSVCGHKQTEAVDKTLHVHTYASEWSKNETSHWKAATCGHSDSFKDFDNHAFGEPVVVPSTETQHGSETYTCGVCGYEKVVELPLAEHTHTWSNGDNWGKDASAHWRYATCDCEDNENLRKDVADHEWGAWDVDDEPTETATGKKSRCCTVCGYVEEAEIPMLAHEHKFNTAWSNDAASHWHAASCGHDVLKDKAAHTWGAWIQDYASTETQQGAKHRFCTVCNYRENDVLPYAEHTHKYATTWTYDSNTHWHEATCGHAVKGNEAAHAAVSGADISWSGAIKCSTCGYIMQPAIKDTTNYIPSDVVSLGANKSEAYKFNLLSDAQIRMEFTNSSGNFAFWIYNSNGTSIASGGYYGVQTHNLITNKTFPAGEYFIKVKASSNGAELLMVNYTFVFAKSEIDTKVLNLTGEDVTYTMYEYEAKYGVDDQYNYVTIENEEGEEVSLYVKDTVNQPTEVGNGSYRFKDANGNTRYLYAPEFSYRSAQIEESPYYFVTFDETSATIAMQEENWLDVLWRDPYWKAISNYNELDARLNAWYADQYVEFYTTYYRKDPVTNTVVKSTTTWDWDGLFDMDFETICEPMTYDNTTGMFKFIKSGKYASFKVTNTTDANFSIFRGFQNASTYSAGNPSKGTYMAQFTYIFDADGHRVNDYRRYSGVSNGSGYQQDNCGWFYKGSNTRANRFEVKPGETYYFLDYDTTSAGYHATLGQTTYTIDLDPNYDDAELVTYLDGNDFRGAYYHKQYNVNTVTDYFLENVDAPEGKVFAGWAPTPTSRVNFRASPWSGFNSTITQTSKRDGTLYAKWMDAENLIMSTRECIEYAAGGELIRYVLSDIVDPTLDLHANDSVNCYYADGTYVENMIVEVGFGTTPYAEISASDIADHPDEDPYVVVKYYGGVSGVHSTHGGLLGIYMEQEFELYVVDEAVDMICDLGVVAKGETTTMPFYGDLSEFDEDVSNWKEYDVLFGAGGDLEGKYFAGWSENGTDIVTLDGGDYTPIRDMGLVPIYKDVEDSKVVALRYGIDFETIGGVEYLKLQVLDPNLTITTATHFTLVFSDGTTAEIGVTQLLTINGVNLPDGAKNSDGVILLNVFNLQTKKADIQRAIQIIAA